MHGEIPQKTVGLRGKWWPTDKEGQIVDSSDVQRNDLCSSTKKHTIRLEPMVMCVMKSGKYVGDTFGTSGQTRCCRRDYDSTKKNVNALFSLLRADLVAHEPKQLVL